MSAQAELAAVQMHDAHLILDPADRISLASAVHLRNVGSMSYVTAPPQANATRPLARLRRRNLAIARALVLLLILLATALGFLVNGLTQPFLGHIFDR